MPLTSIRTPAFKPPRDVTVNWSTWRKGLNTLLRENEVEGSEMTQASNIVLIGSGHGRGALKKGGKVRARMR